MRLSNTIERSSLGLASPGVCSGILAAGVLFLWIVCSWNLVARVNRFTTLFPVVPVRTFSLLLCVLFVSYLAEETLFRGLIQRQLAGIGPVLQVLLSALAYAFTASVGRHASKTLTVPLTLVSSVPTGSP